jgi:hypothetical protein
MNYNNLFVFMITHVKQLGGNGRGVLIIRQTPLQEIISQFDAFLQQPNVANDIQYKKEISSEQPNMVIYIKEGSDEHIVFGKNEQGWKGEYGLTHTDLVISIH